MENQEHEPMFKEILKKVVKNSGDFLLGSLIGGVCPITSLFYLPLADKLYKNLFRNDMEYFDLPDNRATKAGKKFGAVPGIGLKGYALYSAGDYFINDYSSDLDTLWPFVLSNAVALGVRGYQNAKKDLIKEYKEVKESKLEKGISRSPQI